MHRVFEAIFRHPLRLILLLVMLPTLSAAVAYFVVPRTYTTTATLFALKRYEVISSNGPESNLLATQATTQATALTELLQTRAFDIAVGTQANLASTLDPKVARDTAMREDAIVAEISKNVTVTPQSTYIFSIAYTNKRPDIAQKVVAAVIDNFRSQSATFTVLEGQQQIDAYNGQLDKAQKNLQAALDAQSKYLQAHPQLQGSLGAQASDPEYQQLQQATVQAQAVVQGLQGKITELQQDIATVGNGPDTLFSVVDKPQVSNRPDSRTKGLLLAGGLGLVVALLAVVLNIVVAVRRDRALYSALDVARLTPVPVIMQIPRLSGRSHKTSGHPIAGGDFALPRLSGQHDAAL